MPLWSDVALAYAPGLIWVFYFWLKDRREPEPWWLVGHAFVFGCFAALLTLMFRPYVDSLLPMGVHRDWMDAFVATALLEETMKVGLFAAGVLWLRELDEPLDGVVYGIAIGLGFASVENLLYLTAVGQPQVLVARAFTATLLHACTTGVIGYAMVSLKLLGRGDGRLRLALLLAAATVIGHGCYDLLLMTSRGLHWVALLVLLPGTMLALSWKIRLGQASSPRFHPNAG